MTEPTDVSKSESAYEAKKGYDSMKAFLTMKPEEVTKVMTEHFVSKDPEVKKAKSKTEKDLRDIIDNLNKIKDGFGGHTDTRLAWHTKDGYKKLKKIEEDVNDIYKLHKERIEKNMDLKKWFDHFKDVIFRVDQIWDEKSTAEEKKDALVKEGLNRIETIQQLVDALTKFEKWIEEKAAKGEL